MAFTSTEEAVRWFFETNNWTYEEDEEGFFECGLKLDSVIECVRIRAFTGTNALTVMIAPELELKQEKLPELLQYVNLVNGGLMVGCLVLDEEEGVLYFRMGQICTDAMPTEQMMVDFFMYPVSFIDYAGKALMGLLDGSLDPVQAAYQSLSEEKSE